MAKVLFIGDMHLKITKLDLSMRFLSWINDIVSLHKPDLIVNLGDTFDTHSIVRSEIMTEFMKHVDHCRLIAPYVYVLGNHDQFTPNNNKYHALKHLKGRVSDLYIVDETVDLFDMTFVPYIHDPTTFPKQSKEICVAHQTFKGADYGNITTQDGVDACSIDGAQLIVSGHIHKRSRLDLGRTSVLYVGSPFSQNASDINQIKGVSIIDTNSYEEEFIECPLPAWKGLKYELSQNFTVDMLYDDLSFSLNKKDHWIIELSGPKNELNTLLKSDRMRALIKGLSVKIKTSFTDNQKQRIKIQSVSMTEIISDYIDKVYSGSIDRDKLIQVASDIIVNLR